MCSGTCAPSGVQGTALNHVVRAKPLKLKMCLNFRGKSAAHMLHMRAISEHFHPVHISADCSEQYNLRPISPHTKHGGVFRF